MGDHTGYAISADDSPIFFRVSEPDMHPAPATLMLCDGLGCDGFVWKYLRETVADHRVIHWHYRGHGRTPKPRQRSRITIGDFADDVAAVLAETDTDRAVLFGHSMGVQVVLEAYRRHPERVLGMVLVCGAPENPLKTFRRTGAFENALPAVRYAVGKAPSLFNRFARAVVPTQFAYGIAKALEVNDELINPLDFMPYLKGLSRIEVSYFLELLEQATKHTAVDLLPSIAVPTLIVAGEQDGFTPPAQSQRMHESIPGAELLMIERGSHTAPLERPIEVGNAVRDFLSRRLS